MMRTRSKQVGKIKVEDTYITSMKTYFKIGEDILEVETLYEKDGSKSTASISIKN